MAVTTILSQNLNHTSMDTTVEAHSYIQARRLYHAVAGPQRALRLSRTGLR